MNLTRLAQLGAIGCAALAITLTAIELRDRTDASAETPRHVAPERDTDAVRETLARCQALGEAAASDDACLRAWADNRQRFLGTGLQDQPSRHAPDRES